MPPKEKFSLVPKGDGKDKGTILGQKVGYDAAIERQGLGDKRMELDKDGKVVFEPSTGNQDSPAQAA